MPLITTHYHKPLPGALDQRVAAISCLPRLGQTRSSYMYVEISRHYKATGLTHHAKVRRPQECIYTKVRVRWPALYPHLWRWHLSKVLQWTIFSCSLPHIQSHRLYIDNVSMLELPPSVETTSTHSRVAYLASVVILVTAPQLGSPPYQNTPHTAANRTTRETGEAG